MMTQKERRVIFFERNGQKEMEYQNIDDEEYTRKNAPGKGEEKKR
jgi:hypothetical protein